MKRSLIAFQALLASSAVLCQSAEATSIFNAPDQTNNTVEARIEAARNGNKWSNGGKSSGKWGNGKGGGKFSNSRNSWGNGGYRVGWGNGGGGWRNGGGGFANW